MIIALCALAISAGATETKTDYDRSYDLNTLESFKFADQSQRAANDALRGKELIEKRMRSAIQENLSRFGIRENTASPSFIVALYGGAHQQAQISTSGYGPLRWGMGNIRLDQSLEGTAVVDFIDAKTGQLVWRGFVTRTVDPDKSDENIQKAIKKLIDRFAKDREKQQKNHVSK